ncbi:MAG: hypothetical protein M0P27_01720 [Bacteroidales bacterium]|nr:hypothetical protein [Bacteroidales bacterium]
MIDDTGELNSQFFCHDEKASESKNARQSLFFIFRFDPALASSLQLPANQSLWYIYVVKNKPYYENGLCLSKDINLEHTKTNKVKPDATVHTTGECSYDFISRRAGNIIAAGAKVCSERLA